MAGQAKRLPAREIRGVVVLNLPVSLIQRMQPYTAERRRSEFVTAAIAAALDKADRDRDRAAV
jgi:hypothetical protein